MTISYVDDYSSLSIVATKTTLDQLNKKRATLLCAATGGSPTGLYKNLAVEYAHNNELFNELVVVKLDEWGGIPITDKNSCHYYLKENLIDPLHISPERVIAFNSEADNAQQECRRIQSELNQQGPIDLTILGLGKNGHLGFNEPFTFLPHCHVAKLSAQTLQHTMALSMMHAPAFGMTLGMMDILASKKILLLITGKGKREAINSFLSQQITRQLPASFLWLHPNVQCVIDKTSC